MTRVCYDRTTLSLTMEGHAGAGETGFDLVCAALSALMMALERRMEETAERTLPVVKRAPGFFSIRCAPEKSEALCRESFDTVAAGVAVLAENRPENVSLTFMGEDLEQEEEE